MLEAAVGAVWSGARGWLTPPVLFVLVNLVIGTIAVMSKLMSAAAAAESSGDGGERRSLMRAPSAAFDRFRCFSFSRLGLAAEHAPPAPQYSPFDDGAAGEEPPVAQPAWGGVERRMSFLRVPSFALDRLRGLSFSRRDPPADHAPVTPSDDGAADAEPSPLCSSPMEAGTERDREPEPEPAHIERSQSEAAAEAPARRRRARRTRKPAATEEPALAEVDARLPPAVEVDARADDFIRQFREQLRLQRLDSILRYRDTLRRTGTA